MSIFKSQKPKVVRAYRVENLNSENGISASMRVNDREYVVCLCLPTKTVKTVFHNEFSALEQLDKYKSLYKAMK
jgi:hypothetical protein